jgi:hypothetical protein
MLGFRGGVAPAALLATAMALPAAAQGWRAGHASSTRQNIDFCSLYPVHD